MPSTNKISNEDKMVMIAYGGIAVAYAILFLFKYNHIYKSKN